MKKKVHVIGICGVGMSATARLLQEAGWEVSGSDDAFYPPASTYIESLNILVSTGYSPENIPVDTDAFVIGRNAKLAPGENGEVDAALASGKPVYSFPEIIGEKIADRRVAVVAGSYGKSTVTALIAHCLAHAGLELGYFIGAFGANFQHPATLGSHETFVIEGDEYPTAHGDERAKFMHYHPTDLILTSVVHDHYNIFKTPESYQKPFRELVTTIPRDGIIVGCADEPTVSSVLGDRAFVSYGLGKHADCRVYDISYSETTTFTLSYGATKISMETQLLGEHNVQNIAAAATYILARNLLTPEQFRAAIADFAGLARRLDKKTTNSPIPVYEGFGSSYEKARSSIEALRKHFPNRKLIVVFEPHTFSWRNRDSIHWYDTVFADVDTVFIYHPATQGSATHTQISQGEIVDRVNTSGVSAVPINDTESGLSEIVEATTGNSVILLLTSGDLGGLIETLPTHLENKINA